MLSDERALKLINGDNPQNQDEKDFIANYKKETEEWHIIRQAREEAELKQKLQAYREYHSLIMDTLPKSFLYSKPIPYDEVKKLDAEFREKAEQKVFNIIHNPILRKVYGLPIKRMPFPQSEHNFLAQTEDGFVNEFYNKKFGIDVDKLKTEYDSYIAGDFLDRLQNIKQKYNQIFESSFTPRDYISNWDYYDV